MPSYKEALKASLEYFDGDELAAKVFVDKYALRTIDNELVELTPTDMHRRISKALYDVEVQKFGQDALSEQTIFDALDKFRYIIPQGGCMSGIGSPSFVTLSNCYVVDPPKDSYGGIMLTDEQIVQISKRRGGCGTDISKLRPRGAVTHNSSRTSTGPVCFADRFSHSIREVGQNGRRGALMLTMDVHHPDILDFINSKTDKTRLTGANLSVRLSDEFLCAVRDNTTYEQRWPVDSDKPQISREVCAADVWEAITKNAHEHAEPGVLFWDKILSESPADCHKEFKTEGVNPCSELSLSILDSCRLLLINAFSFVEKPFSKKPVFNWRKFYEYARMAQRLMDDIIDLELYYIKRIITKIQNDDESLELKHRELDMWWRVYNNCETGRRTGTGITALADTLAALNLPYACKKSLKFVDRIYKTLKFGCYTASIDMAKTIGPFAVWNAENESRCPFFLRFAEETCDIEDTIIDGSSVMADMMKYGRRNIGLLTSSPAGSTSLETQTSSAIEPVFALSTTRRKKGNPSDEDFRVDFIDAKGDHWMEFTVLHPKLKMWCDITGEQDITKSPWNGSCAKDLDYTYRIKLQATAQRHIDHSISSTINLPADTTVEQVQKIYMLAWELGCKGVTVYRDGCRDGVILDKVAIDKQKSCGTIQDKRPRILPCDVHHTSVQGQSYFVLVGLLDGKPYEVFAGKNGFIPSKVKSGTITRKRKNFYIAHFDDTDDELSPITAATTEMEEMITRLTSLGLRYGADMHKVVQQLEKVGERKAMNSFARGVARVLKKYIVDGTSENEQCPECKSDMIRQEGCVKCTSCAWTRCL